MKSGIKFCQKCELESSLDNNFCPICGSKLPLQYKNNGISPIIDGRKENSDIKYQELKKRLLTLIDSSGYLIVSNNNYFVQFIIDNKNNTLLFDLGDQSNFNSNQSDQLKLLGFTNTNGVINKPVNLQNKQKALDNIIRLTKNVFENVFYIPSTFDFIYEENFDKKKELKNIKQSVSKDKKVEKSVNKILLFAVILFGIIGYYSSSDDNSHIINDKLASANSNTYKDLTQFSGQKFSFKSTYYDKEINGKASFTYNETTYHTFDFVKMIVIQQSYVNGKLLSFKYPIKGFYKEQGLKASTYVIIVGELGIKEIWFSPDVPNIGYDYDDGTRIACYGVTNK